jgi:peptidoglycan/LPS O-acetylase OafA/YrhL
MLPSPFRALATVVRQAGAWEASVSVEQNSVAAPDRIPTLDLLRFVAAAGVMLYHFVTCFPTDPPAISAATRYGYLGVPLFFMISGFVIPWSAMGRTPADFVASRVSRLYPTFWVAMALTIALAFVFQGTLPSVRTLIANMTMVPAMLGSPRIDDIYWTLEIEVRFYALIFVLLILRQMPHFERWLMGWLAAAVVCYFVNEPWAVSFALLMPHAVYFIAGGLFFLVMFRGWTWQRATAIALSSLLSAATAYDGRAGFISADAASAVIVPIVIVVFFGAFAMLRVPVAPGLAYKLGALTYPLYLTHAAVGVFAYRALVPHIGWWALPVIIVLVLLVSWILSVTVDIPARKPVRRWIGQLLAPFGARPQPAAGVIK